MILPLIAWLERHIASFSGAPAPVKTPPVKCPMPEAKVIPAVCLDPRVFESNGPDPWQFCVPKDSRACAAAALKCNQLLQSADGVALPLPGCDQVSPIRRHDRQVRCDCHYRLQPDRRQTSRRVGEERRTDVRFEPNKIERRKKGRRKGDHWNRLRS
jgi:hypothetical protein